MPKRIVLACWGSHGDLFPSLAIAIRLRALGHSPVLATSAYYRERVLAEGIGFHAVRPDVDPADTTWLDRVMDPAHGLEVLLRELMMPNLEAAFADLSEASVGADLLVSHPLTFAVPLIAATRRLPWLSTVLAPMSMLSASDFPLLPPYQSITRVVGLTPWAARAFVRLARTITRRWFEPVRATRHALGLPEAGDPLFEGQFSPCGTLALFSPVLGRPQPDWPPRTTLTGFPFHEETADLPPDLSSFLDAGDPPIVFTLGTSAVGSAKSFYTESVEAAVGLGRRAVLLVGRDPRNRQLTPLPATMRAVEYAPHGPLFSRAAVVVHHGGVGTLARGLRSGRPMLVVPHAYDQLDNARRAKLAGVARVIDARAYTRARAASAIDRLLTDRRYAMRAEQVSLVVNAERGVDRACETILQAAG